MGCWTMAGITFREAARKKILWTALGAGLGFLILFGIALHLFKSWTRPRVPRLLSFATRF